MTKILLIVGMISHWMGCIWYFFGDEPGLFTPTNAWHLVKAASSDVSKNHRLRTADPLEVTPDGEMVLGWVETYFGAMLPFLCVSAAFDTCTCVSAAFVAKTLPFLADFQAVRPTRPI